LKESMMNRRDALTLMAGTLAASGIPAARAAESPAWAAPEFTVPQGKYDWLNKGVFVANLTIRVPQNKRLAKTENENDRMIHVYRLA
jgi:hypothetical protein